MDAGERRVGLALSDETGLLAAPLTVLDRGALGTTGTLERIREVVAREQVARIVVGLPLNEDGSEGRQARRARHFASLVQRVAGVVVESWDERLSTREAEAIIRAQGRSTRTARARGEVDAVAAAVVLQDYLDAQRRRVRHAIEAEGPWPA